MRHKVQLTYRSGRNVVVENGDYSDIYDMIEDMTRQAWFIHPAGAENMMEVERIKPLSAHQVGEPRRIP